MMIPVEGHTGLYRDENSGAIINCNYEEMQNYLQTGEIYSTQKIEIDNMKKEIEELKAILLEVSKKKI